MQLREIIPEYHILVIQILNNMQRVQNYLHTKKAQQTLNVISSISATFMCIECLFEEWMGEGSIGFFIQ